MAKIKKAQDGTLQPMGKDSRKVGENKYVSEDGNYKMKFKGGSDTSAPNSAVQRRTLKGFLTGAPKAAGKMKMKNGGSLSGLKASNKKVGPVDPKGAFTKVQKKTLAGAKGKASLTKDKQLGATKMAKSGANMKKGKSC
jgi:hypothetical protein